jgi:hypothetical protein
LGKNIVRILPVTAFRICICSIGCVVAGCGSTIALSFYPVGREIAAIAHEESYAAPFSLRLSKLGATFTFGKRSDERAATIMLGGRSRAGTDFVVVHYRVGDDDRISHVTYEMGSIAKLSSTVSEKEPNHFPEPPLRAVH